MRAMHISYSEVTSPYYGTFKTLGNTFSDCLCVCFTAVTFISLKPENSFSVKYIYGPCEYLGPV